MKKMRQSGQEKTKKVVVKVVEGIKDGADKLLKGLKITGAFTLGGTAIANANTNADNIFANLDAPKKVQTITKHPSEALTTTNKKTDPKTKALSEGGGDGDDDEDGIDGDETPEHDPHTDLLKNSENYRKNYKIAEYFLLNDASQICAELAIDNKLSENDSKVYLITTYCAFTTSDWTTNEKKAFVGLYFADASWNTASESDINQQFAALMVEAQEYLENGDASKLIMPMTKEQIEEKTKTNNYLAANVTW